MTDENARDETDEALTRSTADAAGSATVGGNTDTSPDADEPHEDSASSHAGPKPVLWVSVTSHGRHDSERALSAVGDDIKDAVGDEYEVIVADDKVRLADTDDIERALREVGEMARDAGLLD